VSYEHEISNPRGRHATTTDCSFKQYFKHILSKGFVIKSHYCGSIHVESEGFLFIYVLSPNIQIR